MSEFPYPLDKMIEGLSNEEYHSVDGLSSTQFDLMRKSMKGIVTGKQIGRASCRERVLRLV